MRGYASLNAGRLLKPALSGGGGEGEGRQREKTKVGENDRRYCGQVVGKTKDEWRNEKTEQKSFMAGKIWKRKKKLMENLRKQ